MANPLAVSVEVTGRTVVAMKKSARPLGFEVGKPMVMAALGVLLSMSLVGCSSEPEVCTSVKDLKSSWSELKSLDVGSGIDDIQAAFATTKDDLDKVFSDAKDEFSSEISAVKTATQELESAAKAAVDDFSADAVTALRTAISEFGTQVQSLVSAVEQTC
jgi:hypothetical protein